MVVEFHNAKREQKVSFYFTNCALKGLQKQQNITIYVTSITWNGRHESISKHRFLVHVL